MWSWVLHVKDIQFLHPPHNFRLLSYVALTVSSSTWQMASARRCERVLQQSMSMKLDLSFIDHPHREWKLLAITCGHICVSFPCCSVTRWHVMELRNKQWHEDNWAFTGDFTWITIIVPNYMLCGHNQRMCPSYHQGALNGLAIGLHTRPSHVGGSHVEYDYLDRRNIPQHTQVCYFMRLLSQFLSSTKSLSACYRVLTFPTIN